MERAKEFKPLSFSTTLRNPGRMADFLNCILPFEGKILTSDIIHEVAINLIINKVYYTEKYEMKVPEYREIYKSDEATFSRLQAEDIIKNSPQNHKEAGFKKGWDSRFDTWYKLPMEFGFIYYAMNEPIKISTTGHMLVDASKEEHINNEKVQNVFLNALMKYQTNNPFRKNANDNVPLLLLLDVIKLLKEDKNENGAGLFRSELSLIICCPDNDSQKLYRIIKRIRKKYGFNYGDEIIYEECLNLLGVGVESQKRFKIEKITGEAIDEFIRKMRITGIISLRGNGRFLDFNSFEIEKINYILSNYKNYKNFKSKLEYFEYMGSIDSNILATKGVEISNVEEIKLKTLQEWADNYSKQEIINEINIVCNNRKSENPILRIIDKPTRFEFLTSIILKQSFKDIGIKPNYHVDDEGIPTFTASGGLADIECFDKECNPLVEVTLMTSRLQSTNEIPAITRHLREAENKYADKVVFSVFVAPTIHTDTKYMVDFSKFKYNLDISAFTIKEFINKLREAVEIKQLKLN